MGRELAGFDFQFFEAVDGSLLDAADYAHRLDAEWFRIMRGRELSSGKLAASCPIIDYGNA